MSDIGEVIKEIRKEAAAITGSALNFNTEEFDVLLLEQIEAICFSKQLINKFSAAELKTIVDTVFNQMRRHDVLEPLINDKSITEIMINGPDKVFIEKNGVVEETDIVFESRERLDDLIQNMVAKVNRSVNEAEPVVDARLEDGSRVNVVLPPVALNAQQYKQGYLLWCFPAPDHCCFRSQRVEAQPRKIF
jgi:pilus assembly protein CpaF